MAGNDTTASPCASICRLDQRTGLCEGCWRSIEEISAWRDATEEERRAILRRVVERRAAAADAEGIGSGPGHGRPGS